MNNFSIKKILLPIDFSEAANNVLETALAMAKRHSASITLLHVVEAGSLFGNIQYAMIAEDAVNSMLEEARESLYKLQQKITSVYNITCNIKIEMGMVANSIVTAATEIQADLIIMGTHGTRGFRDLFIGSNAYRVVKITYCLLLTIPPQKKWFEFKKVFFPVRPIHGALERYNYVRKIIRKNNASLDVLGLSNTYNDNDIHVMKSQIIALRKQLQEDYVTTTVKVKVARNMGEEVLKNAVPEKADLVVITANINDMIKKFFVGPFTQLIINHAKVPVLCIPPTLLKANVHEPNLSLNLS